MAGTLGLRAAAAGVAALAVLAAGCTGISDDADGSADTGGEEPEPTADDGEDTGQDSSSAPGTGEVEVVKTIADGLDSPWGISELPDGGLLVGSRDEVRLDRIDPENGEVFELGNVSGVAPGGEGGLLGLAVQDTWIYAYITAASDNRIVRMTYGDDLGEPEVVFDGIPKNDVVHNGGGIAFGPDGMLYASTGDAGQPELAQDEGSMAGKVLRMTPEGEPPPEGNPDPDSVIYSLGHRNVQGLAWDTEGRLWASEFGEDEYDELNLIEPGGNYGWPEHEGSGGEEDGYLDPVIQWDPAEASPSGLAFADGSLWMATLRGERLWRVPLDGSEPAADAEPQAFLEGEYGRLRAVLAVGDGELLLVTNETDTRGAPAESDDRVLRLRVS